MEGRENWVVGKKGSYDMNKINSRVLVKILLTSVGPAQCPEGDKWCQFAGQLILCTITFLFSKKWAKQNFINNVHL